MNKNISNMYLKDEFLSIDQLKSYKLGQLDGEEKVFVEQCLENNEIYRDTLSTLNIDEVEYIKNISLNINKRIDEILKEPILSSAIWTKRAGYACVSALAILFTWYYWPNREHGQQIVMENNNTINYGQIDASNIIPEKNIRSLSSELIKPKSSLVSKTDVTYHSKTTSEKISTEEIIEEQSPFNQDSTLTHFKKENISSPEISNESTQEIRKEILIEEEREAKTELIYVAAKLEQVKLYNYESSRKAYDPKNPNIGEPAGAKKNKKEGVTVSDRHEFPGGVTALEKYVGDRVFSFSKDHPELSGKNAGVSFIVDGKGKVIKVYSKFADKKLLLQIEHIFLNMPKWEVKKKGIELQYDISISFN